MSIIEYEKAKVLEENRQKTKAFLEEFAKSTKPYWLLASTTNKKNINIFISQAGELSKEIAKIFSDWIKDLIKDVNVFVSSDDIINGSEWFQNILNELRVANFAISILTKENHNKPWINYEYGVLSEILRDNNEKNKKVVPILFDLTPDDLIKEPISQYQCIKWLEKKKIIKIFSEINKLNKENEINAEVFIKKNETAYTKYARRINLLINRNNKKLKSTQNHKKLEKKTIRTKHNLRIFLEKKYPGFLNKSPCPYTQININSKIFKETKNGTKEEYGLNRRTITLNGYYDNYFVICFGIYTLEISYNKVIDFYSSEKINLSLCNDIILSSEGKPRIE